MRIARVRRGKAPSLQHASKANELIDWINTLLECPQLKVSKGRILIGEPVIVTGAFNGRPASGVAIYQTKPAPIVAPPT